MKFIKKTLIVVLTLLLSTTFFTKNTNATDQRFSFSNVDVVIDVSEKGVFTVTETFDVDFYESMRGIYINIPTKYTNYTWLVDGKQVVKDYFWPVSNIKILSNHNSYIERNSYGVSIRLGDADRYANKHETYKIQYKIHSTDLDLGGFQAFYYNIVGDKWNNDIYNATFTINMPKEFDESKIYFYTDGTNLDPNFKYEVNGNTITGSLNTTINYGRGITIKLDLPTDYFDFSKSNTPLIITIISSILLAALSFFTWAKHGKDDEVIVTVEFEAPKELSSAGVGYVMKNSATTKDIASLFLEWANKGYITISEKNDELVFKKVKEIDPNEHSYNVNFFNNIFRRRPIITTDDLDDKYSDYMTAVYGVTKYFNEKDRRLYSQASIGYQILFTFLSILPITIISGYSLYTTYYDAATALIVSAFIGGALLLSFGSIIYLIKNFKGSSLGIKLGILILSISFIMSAIFGSMFIMTSANISPTYFIIIWILTFITIIPTAFMDKRTKFGTEMYGKVLGLKEFIEHAEKDRINMLFEENPQIYYHILPYAYVLGLTNVWRKHFKDMEMVQPDWYEGDHFSYNRFYSNMNSSMSSISRPTPPAPSGSSGGGGSFSSGGGSSFGGGGSSGGGFGGSSGGGW
ncbi:MAG: DUF2207 domain-containing protein [Bacillota bacterium]|nr:DUF2207 domain-containing protein [Bacillota bacterium]